MFPSGFLTFQWMGSVISGLEGEVTISVVVAAGFLFYIGVLVCL